MFSFIIAMGFSNLIGGRSKAIFGDNDFLIRDAAIFRCILPAIMSAALAYDVSGDIAFSVYVLFAVGAGSALWFPWGWSFDEITEKYTAFRYPRWLQRLGLNLCPLDNKSSTNRKRGILMKGVRGAFDIATFALLAPFNPMVMLLWLGTFSMGLVYWLAGKILPQPYSVALGELLYGCLRGLLIGSAIMMTINF